MRIAITGSSGLVGSALVRELSSAGHTIVRVVRSRADLRTATCVLWDPEKGLSDPSQLGTLDAFVHLAGRSVAAARWTQAEKERLTRSRVHATRVLCEQLATLREPPAAFMCASAIGYYGDRGEETVTEQSPPGDDFLARLAVDWEAASTPLSGLPIRILHARLGVVLSEHDGALAKLLPIFRAGLGGPVGSGKQYWSWIGLEDVIQAMIWLINQPNLAGAFNLTAPTPVTNAEFTRVLAQVLKRPAFLPAPAFALRLLLGEMADAALLSSCRAVPERLLGAGYTFRSAELLPALQKILAVTTSKVVAP